MPNYVTITPKYQVVDLADMLKVPEMLVAEQDKANKELEDYKDKISKYRALLGDNADKYFGNYDDLMNTLADNPTIADRKSIANQLRTRFRDVSAKAELAAPALQKWSDYFAKNPHLVGNAGTIDTYMENPNYTPVISDSKALQNDLEDLLIRDLSQQAPKAIGHMEGDPSTLVVRQGRSNEEIAGVIQNTIDALRRGEEPVDVLSKDMYNAALKQGYNNQDEVGKRRLEQSLWKAAPAGFAKTSTKADPEYMDKMARLNYQIANERLKDLQEKNRQEAKVRSIPSGYNKTTFDDDNGNTYAWKEDNKGNLHLQKYNNKNSKWEPVPYADKDGKSTVIYKDGIPITGVTDNKGNSYFKYSGNIGTLNVDSNVNYSRWRIKTLDNGAYEVVGSNNDASLNNKKFPNKWIFRNSDNHTIRDDVEELLKSPLMKDKNGKSVKIVYPGKTEKNKIIVDPTNKKQVDKFKDEMSALNNVLSQVRATDKKNSQAMMVAYKATDGYIYIDIFTNGMSAKDDGILYTEGISGQSMGSQSLENY